MKFISVIILFFLLSQNVYCSTFTCELMRINKKIGIPNSLFYVKKINSLDKYISENICDEYVIFSKIDDSFQIILDGNIRNFTIYLSSLDKNHFVICNNYASKENVLTIYQLLDKEPYLRKIYQTPKNNKDRVSLEVYDWRENFIILKSKSEEGNSGEKIIYFQIDSEK